MKKLLLGTTVIAGTLIAGAAQAADMPLKAPRAAPYYYNWTGFYVGIQGGYGWGTEDLFFAPPTERVHDRGGVFGGQIGAQYQFANNFVVGVEFSGLDSWMKGQLACPNPGFQCHDDVKDVLEVVGRLGYSWGNVLTYIRGGFANSRNHFFNLPPTAFPVNSVSQQHDGFVVGGGFDYALGNNFVIGLEFSHVGLNKKTYTSGGATFNIEPEANIIAARLSYLFGTGGWGRY